MRPGSPTRGRRCTRALRVTCAFLAAQAIAGSATAAPVVGSREDFTGITTNGWAGGATASNPGTGGLFGAGDGYLQISIPGPVAGFLGASAPTPAYAGDWNAAGITQVRFWLNDVNAQDPLEIHFAIGNSLLGNFWQCNTGFIPPPNQWAPFVVDLSTPANFTFIGTGAAHFDSALMNVDRILIRHDRAPYGKLPDAVIGDVGVDGILLTNGVAGVDGPFRTAVGQPVRLAPPAPNPSRGAVMLRMDAAGSGPIALQVLDALGRVVRRGELPAAAPGSRSWTWDGADDRGVPAAPGYYRVRAIGSAGGTSQPLLRLP
jgi:hypothetical protein